MPEEKLIARCVAIETREVTRTERGEIRKTGERKIARLSVNHDQDLMVPFYEHSPVQFVIGEGYDLFIKPVHPVCLT